MLYETEEHSKRVRGQQGYGSSGETVQLQKIHEFSEDLTEEFQIALIKNSQKKIQNKFKKKMEKKL